jgi:hypothetical protein
MVRLTMRTYMSVHFLVAAWQLAQDAKKIEGIEKDKESSDFFLKHRAYVISSILTSVAFLEALINELFADASEGQTLSFPGLAQPTSELLGTMWRLDIPRTASYPILKKYRVALALAGKSGLDTSASWYGDVDVVVKLRNALVHYEPETIPTDSTRDPDEIHKLEKRLKRKFCENPLTSDGNAFYPDKCLSFGCAAWAFDACVPLADEFCSRLGIQAPYCHQKLRLPALTKDP